MKVEVRPISGTLEPGELIVMHVLVGTIVVEVELPTAPDVASPTIQGVRGAAPSDSDDLGGMLLPSYMVGHS